MSLAGKISALAEEAKADNELAALVLWTLAAALRTGTEQTLALLAREHAVAVRSALVAEQRLHEGAPS